MMAAQYLVKNLAKTVDAVGGPLDILSRVNLEVEAGASLAVVGASGCGKSTLMHILGALDTASRGEVFFEERDISLLNTAQKAYFRNRELGFVFQFHHLLPEFSTEENVAMQAIIGGMPRRQALEMAGETLNRVGLAERRKHGVTTLSGGERQRAAIARAVLMQPKVLLADEPTGNLDEHTGNMVMDLLLELNHERNMTLLMVTHNRELAARMGRCLELRLGELYEHNVC